MNEDINAPENIAETGDARDMIQTTPYHHFSLVTFEGNGEAVGLAPITRTFSVVQRSDTANFSAARMQYLLRLGAHTYMGWLQEHTGLAADQLLLHDIVITAISPMGWMTDEEYNEGIELPTNGSGQTEATH